MLFDLRGRGRRRFVQGIYLGLAILMGGGLVLFGVGGATNGGLLDAFKNDSGGTSVSDTFKKRVESAEKGVQARPQDPRAWAELTRVRFQQASVGDGFDQNNGVFTDKGKQQLQAASQSWDKYLTLTDKPDDTVASLMVQAYGQYGLNEPDKAVNAMEIIIDRRQPTSQLYVQLASLAYQAGQTRKAELSSKKALSLASKDDKEQVKAALDAARTAASATASTAAPATTSTPSN
jgi:predicted  nucleic acid-binding Zn-ribbon protein